MKLLEPTQIGRMTLRNRVFMAPMGTTTEEDGSFSERSIRYYEERARGGFGLIITGANQVTTAYEQKACNIIGTERSAVQMRNLADRMHAAGAKLCIQITPGLGRMQLPFAAEVAPLAASAVESYWFPGLMCEPLSVEQIQDLVAKMGEGAAMAKAAGADAVEIHGYGGYLIDQFSSSLWNTRTDQYGGDLEGRMRFGLEIVASVRDAVGPDFPILYKYTPYHGVPGGRELEEGLAQTRLIQEAGVDALHVDMGCYEAWYKAIPTVYQPAALQSWLAAEVKKIATVPVLTHGKLNDPAVAEGILADGKGDLVGLGHGALAEPNWVNKIQENRAYDITPCIGCNECLFAGFKGGNYVCAVNPACFDEASKQVTPVAEPKRALVLGGGPGGMEFAITAAERGIDVELWEKGPRLGGTLHAAGGPSFKSDVKDYAEVLVGRTFRADVTVRTMKDATAEEILAGGWDKVVLATGARHAMPPIPGIESASVVKANDVLTGRASHGRRVVVIGAGLVGCEAAAMIAQTADAVTVVEMEETILATVEHCRNNELALAQLLEDSDLEFVTGARVTQITDDGLTYSTNDAEVTIDADTVVIAAGYRPNDELLAQLEGKVDVSVIGDAVEADSILSAVHGGFQLARAIGAEEPVPGMETAADQARSGS
ncbi:NAD(P)/FAD-dependent oxidoreductase [Demequina lignilytica]|uniref:NAD(P)/FAD-dependent oxidoreductase n=1 Tax=Demequina lignilytica TaxID=3051663 RepID=A0AB35MIL9_9MICO|nr:NAD(P)/FAD-dependent oxidoreductase [Demequina sp. SYSU T0a273]MDN4483577.1 NAD(P)/FAD-dependent oxidoreductase [Demequina sp. SYSU T0a273]